ncbi:MULTISPECIES: gamma-glutamyltransferase family protein [Hyphomonas]|uniref:Gamma-glutamyltransferase n=1 Tax=Hyphomonas adhaerens TaxID=81029 RepID=A0A3B9GXS8_9PROT|nr:MULTISPECIES: gamma-glutamyltransferase family protein [Hyphomonas]MBB39571.1 gamma-glutamyltransferase [Hyphomonas sp.]HAE27198.1 gamma-glutamyltransferase [Hyphomonas adhaerens]|tara:strand:- start:2383 stop:4197 length:1815 start_codon:yes stop_codon:yes gene_type:complete
MKRRQFLLTGPATAALALSACTTAPPAALAAQAAPAAPPPDDAPPPLSNTIYSGDRLAGAPFASRSVVWGMNGVAATSHPRATLVALDILRKGGSAVDAAIAANATLGVVEPTANGIGGDAFCLMWDPALGKVVGLNGSGHSPAGLSLETLRARSPSGRVPFHGAPAVTVPGAVDAWWTMHQRYGKLPWKDLMEPAAGIAEEGMPLALMIAARMKSDMAYFLRPDSGIEEVENVKSIYYTRGRTPEEGEIVRNPDLARTLRMIGEGGRDAYYDGPIADTIEAYFKRIGGWMTRADLAAQHAKWVEPNHVDYRAGVTVYGMPPNSQGPTTLQMLSILKNFDMREAGLMTAQSIHYQAEAKRLAFEDRARWFADPDFADIPIDMLLSDSYGQQRASLIRPDRPMARAFPGDAPHQGGTTYLTVSDSSGMMVSLIQSNYAGMGSGLMADGLGFSFQNRGAGFSLQEDSPNLYAPRKRPFHTIIPGFATKDGAPWLAFGVMGGGMQPQGQTQIILNIVDYDLDLQAAGDCPRWRHDGSSQPTGVYTPGLGTLKLETGVPETTKALLARMGWTVGGTDGGFGGYQATMFTGESYGAASEMRKDGLALGY